MKNDFNNQNELSDEALRIAINQSLDVHGDDASKGKWVGPNKFNEIINEAWERKVAIETQMLPVYFNELRNSYYKKKKMLEQIGKKGKYTDSYGWSKDGDFLWKADVPSGLQNYFRMLWGTSFFYSDEGDKRFNKLINDIIKGDHVDDILRRYILGTNTSGISVKKTV